MHWFLIQGRRILFLARALNSNVVKVDLFEELVRYENYLSRLDELRRQNAISDKTYLALKEEYTKRVRSLKEKLKS
jgi:hypothetical protein